ncbi:hypothetical protein AC1031_009441 [Aphanomyces cochlioides]|nr:hypothetical protein AC1031_009441 [Aphanomyces cochlioides]
MKFFAFLLAIALPLVYAAECAESDLLTLAPSMLACETALGRSVSSIARGDISTFSALCKYPDCQTMLKAFGALTCTFNGQSLTSVGSCAVCSPKYHRREISLEIRLVARHQPQQLLLATQALRQQSRQSLLSAPLRFRAW